MRGYRLLRQPRGGPLTPRQEALLAQLVAYAQPLLLVVLRNAATFETKGEFLDEVDRLAADPGKSYLRRWRRKRSAASAGWCHPSVQGTFSKM